MKGCDEIAGLPAVLLFMGAASEGIASSDGVAASDGIGRWV